MSATVKQLLKSDSICESYAQMKKGPVFGSQCSIPSYFATQQLLIYHPHLRIAAILRWETNQVHSITFSNQSFIGLLPLRKLKKYPVYPHNPCAF